MPKLRTLSGDDLLRIFSQLGFGKYSQRGSHVKLRRVLSNGSCQTLTIVAHQGSGQGYAASQALRYVPVGTRSAFFRGLML